MDDKFEQISISDLISILIKRKKIIAISIAGFLILGILSSFVITKQMYSSEMTLEINSIDATVPKSPSVQAGPADNIIESITSANEMDFDSYLSKILSEPILEKTIKDLKLEGTYTAGSLKKALSISSDSETKKIKVSLILSNREEGAEILNSLEENFSDYITKLSAENTLKTLEVIEEQMKVEKEKYAESLKEYKQAMKDNSTAKELEFEIEGKYKQLTDYKLSLNDLEIKIDSVTSAIEKSGSNNNGMYLRPEKGNGYVYMGSNKDSLEIELAESQSKLKSTREKIESLKEDLQVLQIDYQDVEFVESTLRQNVDLTKQSYEVFSKKYQELKMEGSIDLGSISINKISGPSPTGNPVGTRKAIKLAVFLILGLITGVILAFLVEYLDMLKAKRRNIN